MIGPQAPILRPRPHRQFGICQTLLTTADGCRIEFQRFDDPHWDDAR